MGLESFLGVIDPKLLVAGDRVRVEIEGIGQIDNPVIAEPEDTASIV